MKVYQFVRNDRDECVLYVIQRGEQVRAVPMVIANEPGNVRTLMTAVTAMLCSYFSDETDGAAKAACLTRPVALRLALRAIRGHFVVTEDELGGLIASVMTDAYESLNVGAGNLVVEQVSGHRRDRWRAMLTGSGRIC
jgi:hypothetical protein